MASRMRRVRKSFRKDVLDLVGRGEGSVENLTKLADGHFGKDVGYQVVQGAFLASEVGNAMAYLRNEGLIESIGGFWKCMVDLESGDVDTVSIRRLKRIRGEWKSEKAIAHSHGRIDDAIYAGQQIEILNQKIESAASASENIAPVS